MLDLWPSVFVQLVWCRLGGNKNERRSGRATSLSEMDSRIEPERNRQDSREEAAIYDDAKDHRQEEDDPKDHRQAADDAKDHRQEEDDAKDHHQQDDTDSDIERQETDNILEHAIEYLMKGAYPPGLTKDKKRAVRKRAQTISVEEGEVYIKRKRNKVGLLQRIS